ncbi:LOW QUALITY PROTEIN: reticulon-like protein B14 [Brassica napus]|nr:LOW QUALITY PROTEIN: reticulon-like protein B14 [Brassica napus]
MSFATCKGHIYLSLFSNHFLLYESKNKSLLIFGVEKIDIYIYIYKPCILDLSYQKGYIAIYGSEMDEHGASSSRKRRSLYHNLGGGHFADVMFWKNKKESGTILAVFTLIWFLFEVVEYPFITFICQILLVSIFIFLIWSYIGSSQLIHREPPSINDLKISESTWRFLFNKINWFIIKLYDISSGKDFRLLVLAVVSLWILSVVGNYFSSLTLLYIVFVALETIPMLYELYEEELNYAASKSGRDMKKLFNDFNSKVINKIPKANAKTRRHM